MAGDRDSGQTSELVQLAAKAAGVTIKHFDARLVSGGTINRTSIVRVEDGSQYVLQEYGWPFSEPDDLDRFEKEAWLSDLVRTRGIPAPRQLSRLTVEDVAVVLREFLPGQPLGDVPITCASAWRSAGEMLAKPVANYDLPRCAGVGA